MAPGGPRSDRLFALKGSAIYLYLPDRREWVRAGDLPRVTVHNVSSMTGGVTKFSVGPDRRTRSLDFGFSWDLADLIWSSDQTSIDVRSRLTTQLRQDLLEEATRLYFERRRLRAEFEEHPAEDAALRQERRLRVEDLTAYLDALTGGGFSGRRDEDNRL